VRDSSLPVKFFLLGFGGFAIWSAVTGGFDIPASGEERISQEKDVHGPCDYVNVAEVGYGGATSDKFPQGDPGVASDKELEGWIRAALCVMDQQGIPGSYDGVHRNLIRESGGNPGICNTTDINYINGVPSCGLLQVIPTTYDANKLPQSAYDRAGVKADANDRFDPVANLVTACNYAAHRYGSIDNVWGAY